MECKLRSKQAEVKELTIEHSTTQGPLGDAVVIHPLDPRDASTIAQITTAARAQKGVRWRIDARKQLDALMEAVSPRNDVTFEAADGRIG